jgi:glycosyltransferase involved in cell wall biosynthesis
MEKALNIVFFPTSVNFGLAGTNRLQNIIYFLKKENTDSISNIALEDKSKLFEKGNEELFLKNYKEIYYAPSIAKFIRHIFTTSWYILKSRKKESKNLIYFYGEIDIKNFFFVIWARLLGFRIVIDVVEDLDAVHKFRSFKNKIKYKSAVFFRKRLNRFADGFIVVSIHLSNKFSDKFPDSPQFFLPVTINKDLLHGESKLSPDQTLVVFYSGSFNEKDGLPYLIRGLKKVKDQGKKFKLVLSGKGTHKEMTFFWGEVENCGLKSEVDYRGLLNRSSYVNILANEVDVLCMTRINSAFANAGFPFKLGEFLATGKPVIASKIGDVEKYLSKNDAFLVEPENEEQIKAALIDIIENPEAARQIGINGKKVAMAYFDHQQYSTGLKDFMTDKIWL